MRGLQDFEFMQTGLRRAAMKGEQGPVEEGCPEERAKAGKG